MPDQEFINRIREANARIEEILRKSDPKARLVVEEFVNSVFNILNDINDVNPHWKLICQQYLQSRLALANAHDVDAYLQAVDTITKAQNGR